MSGADSEAPKPADDESLARLREELEAEKQHIAALEAENAALLSARGGEAGGGGKPKSVRRSHRFWVAILLIVACLLTPLSIIALFVKNEIGDTGRYVQTVKPLASDPAVQSYVADDVADELFARVDIKRYVKQALPKRADVLSGPLTSALQTFVRAAVLRVLQTSQFQTIWVEANELAHSQLVNVLEGDANGTIAATKNGAVTINLSAVSKQVEAQLENSGIDLFSSVPIASIGGKITVFQSNDLYKARSGFKILNTLAFVLPFIILGCFAGAIYLSKNRRKGFVGSAIAFAIGALILAIVLAVGRGLYLNTATSHALPYDAAAAMFDTLVRFLHQSVRAVLFLSIIVIVAVFFAGPSRFARWFRTRIRQGANWLGHESERAGWQWLAPNDLVVRYKGRLRIAVAGIAFLILFRWNHPTASVVLYVALLALLVLAIIEFFGREPLPEPVLDEPPGDPAPAVAGALPAAGTSG